MVTKEQDRTEVFLTRKQLSEILKVSVVTIQRWGREGCPKFEVGTAIHPKGRRPRYRLSEVLAWLKARSEPHRSLADS